MIQKNNIPNHRKEKMPNVQLVEMMREMMTEMKKDLILNIQTEIKKEIKSAIAQVETSITNIESSQSEMKKGLESSIAQIQSEVRTRYYDMQNLAYAGHSISDPGHVSTAAAVGRSPRRYINSYDTFR